MKDHNARSDYPIPDYENSVAMGPETSSSLTESNDVKYGYMVRVVFDPQDCNRHRVIMEGLLWRRCRTFDDPDTISFSWAKNNARLDAVRKRKEREKRWGVHRDARGRFY